MTTTTDLDREPDHILEAQAAAEGLTPPPQRRPSGAPPHDTEAERALIGLMLYSLDACDTILSAGLTADDLYVPSHRTILDAIQACLGAGEPPDPITVASRAPELDVPTLVALQIASPDPSRAAAYTRIVRHHARCRRTQASALEAAQAAATGDLPAALRHIDAITTAADPLSATIPHQPLAQFITETEDAYDWIIPGLLERHDRVLLTGPEGGGKSTLLRQIAVQAAGGLHPFAGIDTPPIRVLLLDLENSERQIRRAIRPLRASAGTAADDTLHIAVHPQGLDLTDPADVSVLGHLIASVAPDLVIGGPVYRLVGGDPIAEEPAREASMVLDRLRVQHGFALMLETHQPHGSGNERPERPYGASLWKRWPEFGLHIAATGNLRHWRGARDEREWPAALERGGEWPWTVATDRSAGSFSAIVNAIRDRGRVLSQRELVEVLGVPKTNVARAIAANRKQWDALVADIEGDK